MTEKKIVIPGEMIVEGDDYLPGHGTYKNNGQVRSKILGMVKIKDENLISVIPLSGQYMPSVGDGVIGVVSDVNVSSWMIDVNCPYIGFLSLSDGIEEFVDLQKTDITKFFDVGDVVYAKINNVSKRKDIKLSMRDRMCRKLNDGNLIRVNPSKVPRLIGTGGSMIELVKNKTDCHIIIGQNGLVWINGGNIEKATAAVRLIEENAHTSGLTERVEKFLGE